MYSSFGHFEYLCECCLVLIKDQSKLTLLILAINIKIELHIIIIDL